MVVASKAAISRPGQAAEELADVRQMQAWGVPVVIADPQLPNIGYAHLRQRIEEDVQAAVQKAMDGMKKSWGNDLIDEAEQQSALVDPKHSPLGNLHQAIDAYKKHLEQAGTRNADGILTAHVRKCLEWLDMLKEHHEDCMLLRLDHSRISTMVAYWRNRPPTKRGGRCSTDHCQQMVKQLYRFLRWLDSQPKYRWSMPKGVGDLQRAPIRLPEDDQHHQTAFRSNEVPTFSPAQLVVLADHADDFMKALIGVCVNCAFGASEVGQWPTSNYQLNKPHPYASVIGIESSERDSWVVGKRPKTGIYGEHLLWEEVALAVQPYLDGRRVLPITSTGQAWYRPHSKNAQSHFGSRWSNLLDRVQEKHPDFPRLPFGSLRDLLPNVLRRDYSDEIASLAVQHGEVSDDNLLDAYANLPFKRLFEATIQLRGYFAPFLACLLAE